MNQSRPVLLVLEDAAGYYHTTICCSYCTSPVTHDSLFAKSSLMSLQGFIFFPLTFWASVSSLIIRILQSHLLSFYKVDRCQVINIFLHCTRWYHQSIFVQVIFGWSCTSQFLFFPTYSYACTVQKSLLHILNPNCLDNKSILVGCYKKSFTY